MKTSSTTVNVPTNLSPTANRRPCILLRSSWQTVNIGDIGHTPGLLALLKKHIPDARVILWPTLLDRGVHEVLMAEFPNLKIVDGRLTKDGQPDSDAMRDAFANADFLLHGSGPHLLGLKAIQAWVASTGKPYGIYGITQDPLGYDHDDPERPTEGAPLDKQRRQIKALAPDHMSEAERTAFEAADFVFCRDSLTLAYLQGQCPNARHISFAPDAAFGIESRDDATARAFLKKHVLSEGEFVCVIPRLRYTPYHLTHNRPATRRDTRRAEISDRHRERDLAKIRDLITRWVRTTGRKILLCPEMTYQIEVGKTSIYDFLPVDVQDRVVWRSDYWLPGEACSVYAMSEALVSMDNHSPIFALAMGTPSIFLRHTTDTIKGEMWPDLSMGDWFVETDATDGKDLFERMMAIHNDRPAALAKLRAFMDGVHEHQHRTMAVLATSLSQALQPSNQQA
ncbi:MAG: polysaccharide pyruvyl transferase family protein [Opitutaceae bacterium]|jgi:polysaccharide pyruvyl transferase WcaK-like protein